MELRSPQVRSRPAGRRERKKAALRRRILEVAVALFDARGFEATRVADICRAADVAEKTFFNHFASKRALLRAVADEALERLLRDLEAARKRPGSTASRIEWLLLHVADEAVRAGPLHREVLTEMVHAASEAGAGPTRRLHRAFGALVRDGVEAGELPAEGGDAARTELLLGAFYVLMFDHAHLEGHPVRERARELAALLGRALAVPPGGNPV